MSPWRSVLDPKNQEVNKSHYLLIVVDEFIKKITTYYTTDLGNYTITECILEITQWISAKGQWMSENGQKIYHFIVNQFYLCTK